MAEPLASARGAPLVGVDVASIERVAGTMARHPQLGTRAFTPAERAECEGRPDRWASRWAAKEAVRKLWGAAGVRPLPAFAAIEVLSGGDGPPVVRVEGGDSGIALSLSHDAGLAIAVAVAPRRAHDPLDDPPLGGVPASLRLPERAPDSHKGTFGTVVVAAGSHGFSGAAWLAAMGAARAGAGLVRLCVPAELHPAMVVKSVEVMPHALPDGGRGVIGAAAVARLRAEQLPLADALVVGPGIGRDEETGLALETLLDGLPCPAVVDADGLTLAGRYGFDWRRSGKPVVVTPHPAEMARLLGGEATAADVQRDRHGVAAHYAAERGAIVVLKGAHTVVAAPDGRLWEAPYALPALATGGTGDVLSGVSGAFLAAGIEAFDAAVAAVCVHGEAGAELQAARGRAGTLASDVLDQLPTAQERLRRAVERAP